VPGEATAGTDGLIPPKQPVPETRKAPGKKAHSDKEGYVGGSLEVGNPIALVTTPRATANAGMKLKASGYGGATSGAPGRSGLKGFAAG